jgi:hypothetical protein
MGDDALIRRLQDVERAQRELAAADLLATAGIGVVPNGVLVNGLMNFNREDGTLGVQADPQSGTFTVFDDTGVTAVARFGELLETAPGEYGVEVLVGSTWVRLGDQSTTWDSVSGKPSTFPPSSHTHVGADITSGAVPEAEGSQYGWTNTVGGTEFYALWVGNNGGYKFGRNTSSLKYKENVRDADTAHDVLSLRPVIYDRKPTFQYPEDSDGNRLIGPPQMFEGAKNEFGLIAEEVAPVLPEIVTRYGGEIDGVRYDLLGVALIPVVQEQQHRISVLEDQVAKLTQAVWELGGNV